MNKENEPHKWSHEDSTKSLRDIIAIGRLALAELINRVSGVKDERN